MRLLALIVAFGFLAACGLKDDLYLPEQQPNPAIPASTPTATDEDTEKPKPRP